MDNFVSLFYSTQADPLGLLAPQPPERLLVTVTKFYTRRASKMTLGKGTVTKPGDPSSSPKIQTVEGTGKLSSDLLMRATHIKIDKRNNNLQTKNQKPSPQFKQFRC